MIHKALLLIFAISCGYLHAKPREVACRFLYFGAPGEIPKVIAVSADGLEVPCMTPTAAFSPTKKYLVDENTLKLVSEDKKPLVSGVIPQGSSSVFIVLIKTSNAGTANWRALVVDDDPKNFPPGGAYVVNFNQGDIRFAIGEHRGTLKRGTTYGYEMPTKRDDFNMAQVDFWIEREGKWRVANQSSIQFLPNFRYMFIAYNDPITGRPTLHTVTDQ